MEIYYDRRGSRSEADDSVILGYYGVFGTPVIADAAFATVSVVVKLGDQGRLMSFDYYDYAWHARNVVNWYGAMMNGDGELNTWYSSTHYGVIASRNGPNTTIYTRNAWSEAYRQINDPFPGVATVSEGPIVTTIDSGYRIIYSRASAGVPWNWQTNIYLPSVSSIPQLGFSYSYGAAGGGVQTGIARSGSWTAFIGSLTTQTDYTYVQPLLLSGGTKVVNPGATQHCFPIFFATTGSTGNELMVYGGYVGSSMDSMGLNVTVEL